MNNKVVVEMKDASIKKQENFKSKLSISRKKMNMSAIEYVEAEQPKSYAKTINSGGEIYGRQIVLHMSQYVLWGLEQSIIINMDM